VNCDGLRAMLGALREGPLADDLRSAALRHLELCPACRSLLDRRDRLEALIRAALPVPDPGEAYFEGLRSRLLPAPGAAGVRRKIGAVPILAAAALAAAAVVLITFGSSLLRKAAPVPELRAPIVQSPAPAAPPGGPPAGIAKPPDPPLPRAAAPPTGREGAPKAPEIPVPLPPPSAPREALALPAGPPPGTAARQARMTGEAVEVALAETPAERVLALCAAAEAQLRDLPGAIATDPALAAELAGAYRLLVAEGVAGVLREQGEPEQELAQARGVAERRARDHEAALVALSGGTSGPLRESLALALEASRSISGRR